MPHNTRTFVFNGGFLAQSEVYGVQRCAYELIRELDGLVGGDDATYQLAIPDTCADVPRFANIQVVKLKGGFPVLANTYWNQVSFARYVKSERALGVDLALGLPAGACDVVCIHDCITERLAQNARSLRSKLYRLQYRTLARHALRSCKAALTVSEFSRDDIVDCYGCDPSLLHVVGNGWEHVALVESDPTVLDRLNVRKGEYFFSLGSRSAHKNYRWILCAAQQNPQCTFVVSGTSNLNDSDPVLRDVVPSNLLFTGYLSDSEIKALMEGCRAFIHPSLYEGFGIPPLEALSVGARCIVSSATALPEVYGGAVTYIDPCDYEHIDMDALMAEVPQDGPDSVLERHSWKRNAQALLDVLHGVHYG